MMFQVIKAARFGVAHTRSCRGRRAQAGALIAEMTLSQSLPDDVQFHKWKEINRWKKEEDRSPRKLVAWTPRNPMNWQPSNHKLRQSLHISREALLSERKGSHAWLGISHGLSFGYMSRFFAIDNFSGRCWNSKGFGKEGNACDTSKCPDHDVYYKHEGWQEAKVERTRISNIASA